MKTNPFIFLIIPFCALSQPKSASSTLEHSVVHYRFNPSETLPAMEGSRNVGTIATEDRFGNPGHAIYLFGTEKSYVNLGTDPRLKPAEGALSIWFRMDNVMESGVGYKVNPVILTKSLCADDFYEAYSLAYQNNTRRLAVTSSYGEQFQFTMLSPMIIETGKWYHAVMSWTHSQVSLFINGRQAGRVKKTFRVRYLEGDSVMVGNSANAKNQRFFNGAVDDIAVFNRPLSAAEVEALYNQPNPNRGKDIALAALIVAGISVLIAALALVIRAYYSRQAKKVRDIAALRSRYYDLQLTVLRAQMNPHFLFNAMGALQQLISDGQNQRALEYLAKLSRLLRHLLKASHKPSISLQEEVGALSSYLELERLRANSPFEYEIITSPEVERMNILMPPMMIQPLAENALVHGIYPNGKGGKLSISLSLMAATTLVCVVEDNGVGRNTDHDNRPTDVHALEIIETRLAAMRDTGAKAQLHYEDLKEEQNRRGTKAILYLPITV